MKISILIFKGQNKKNKNEGKNRINKIYDQRKYSAKEVGCSPQSKWQWFSATLFEFMENKLRFKNGRFRIMITTDGHERPEEITEKDKAIIEDYLNLQYSAIEYLKPDMVVLDGDNCYTDTSEDEIFKQLKRITQPYEKHNIPFAFVLGNHEPADDPESVKEIYKLYRQLPTCLLPEDKDLSYMGDYNLTVLSEDGSKRILNLWLINSGSEATDKYFGGYAFVQDKQIKWYKEKAMELRIATGKTVPAVLFQHMPVPEEFRLLNQSLSPLSLLKGGIRGCGPKEKGRYFTLDTSVASGHLGECPCPPDYNNGEFEAWKDTGDIFAAFFGHDHTNDFIGMVDGITLGQCITSGFNAYGDASRRGVRVLDIYENNPRNFTTRSIYFDEITGSKPKSV